MNINTVINELSSQLQSSFDPETAVQHAWWIIEHVTQQSRASLLTNPQPVSDITYTQALHIVDQIITHHKPLAYIIGSVPFLDMQLHIEPPVLIPRPETEEWVAWLIDQLQPVKHLPLIIADIGTGSGCIALALARAFPKSHIWALDITPEALACTQKNAHALNVKNITIMHSNVLDAVSQQSFDVIVSNPPYIDPALAPTLAPSVTQWESPTALFASQHGLAIIERIIHAARRQLTDTLHKQNLPSLVIEIDHTQGTVIQEMMQETGFIQSGIWKDLQSKDRVAWAIS